MKVTLTERWRNWEKGETFEIADAVAKALIENGYAKPAETAAVEKAVKEEAPERAVRYEGKGQRAKGRS